MIDKFGNIFYLIIYLVHFIIVGSYAFQLVFGTQKFLEGRGVDKTATLITRFAGSFMIAMVLMAIYIAFIRSGGLDATWAFFNLVFIINVTILCANFYTLKIDKTATLITRFACSFMIDTVLMAIYIAFIRSGGVEATWAFFNLVFIMNVSILVVNFYTLKIDKTGLTKKTRNDGIYAPLVLVIISAILCYGLADKIYV